MIMIDQILQVEPRYLQLDLVKCLRQASAAVPLVICNYCSLYWIT